MQHSIYIFQIYWILCVISYYQQLVKEDNTVYPNVSIIHHILVADPGYVERCGSKNPSFLCGICFIEMFNK